MKKKIVITGGTGRIGQALLSSQSPKNYEIHAIVRSKKNLPSVLRDCVNCTFHEIEDLSTCSISDLSPIFIGATSVIHLAAAIHENTSPVDSATVLMAKNVALAAVKTEVQNIIVLSSISARIALEGAANARTYGYRKLAAEKAFNQSHEYGQSVIILRPPAVYGAGMGGTLKLLTSLIKNRVPLPLGLAHELRDYISINNMVGLIWHITNHQLAGTIRPGTRTYEPCDGRSINTKSLVLEIANTLKQKTLLVPIPISVLNIGAKLLNKTELVDGAVGQLTAYGNSALLDDFGWSPIEEVPDSLKYLQK